MGPLVADWRLNKAVVDMVAQRVLATNRPVVTIREFFRFAKCYAGSAAELGQHNDPASRTIPLPGISAAAGS
jgi:hypothetical protein